MNAIRTLPAIALSIGALWSGAAPAEGLFSPLKGQRDVRAVDGVDAALRPRLVRVDTAKLDAARRRVANGAEAPLTFNLTAEAAYRVIVEHTAPTASGYSLAGRIDGMPVGRVVLVVNGDILVGTVWTEHGSYTIRTRGAGVYSVEKVDPAKALPLAEPLVLPLPKDAPPSIHKAPPPAEEDGTAQQDHAVEVDVLVLWTPAARTLAGGLRRVRAAVDQMVATANDAYRLGGVAQRVHLAGAAELNYQNSTLEDIGRLPIKDDGFLDEIHTLRDSYAADIVSLIVEFEIGGIAVLLVDLLPEFEALAFNMVNVTAPPTIFAHEIGHNMGLVHDRYTLAKYSGPESDLAVWPALSPYSFGYVNERAFSAGRACWHTIMAYPDQCDDSGLIAVGLPRFSHPDQTHPAVGGDPLGVPLDAPDTLLRGPTHAARSLNESRHVVAEFRDAAERCDYALSISAESDVEVPAGGGSFVVRVETASHCQWQAHHQADFMVASPVTLQSGPGDVVYQVQANPGAARTGAASIAAETFGVRQPGLVAPVSVCARSAAVRRAITLATEKDCAALTVWDLVEVTMLSLEGQDPAAPVQPGDFDGLVNLAQLSTRLAGDVTPLAALYNLRVLTVNSSEIVDLSPLAGLARLQFLDLADNRIVDIAPLAGLPQLLLLSLRGNAIADLTPLAGLTNLVSLDVADNAISDISPLQPLPILTLLWLDDNMVDDLSALAGKLYLAFLGAAGNAVDDASPLLAAEGLEQVDLRRNPLTQETVEQHIGALLARGVTVLFDEPVPSAALLRGWRLGVAAEEG